jgi:transposase
MLYATYYVKDMLKSRDIQERLKEIDAFLLVQYKEAKKEKRRDWQSYEQQLMSRIKGAIRNLEPLIEEAVTFQVIRGDGRGRRPELTLKQKVTLLLLKELYGKSNRMMAFTLTVFSLLAEVDVSYKTVERLYSDSEVEVAIHNLHILLLKRKRVEDVDASGDGTGYSLTVRKHYASEAAKNRSKAKEPHGERTFIYSFRLLDLKSKMYVAYGASFKSEKEAFNKAMEMCRDSGVNVESVRLDRYYSSPSYVDRFGDAKVYIIPRKNATVKGSWKWKDTMAEFVRNTLPYLGQYYLRNYSESGFSADKRWFGWKVAQKREDRIDTALNCTSLWHNLLNLYTN